MNYFVTDRLGLIDKNYINHLIEADNAPFVALEIVWHHMHNGAYLEQIYDEKFAGVVVIGRGYECHKLMYFRILA